MDTEKIINNIENTFIALPSLPNKQTTPITWGWKYILSTLFFVAFVYLVHILPKTKYANNINKLFNQPFIQNDTLYIINKNDIIDELRL